MPKYTVGGTPISIKPGAIAQPGDTVELEAKAAEELLKAGMISKAASPAKADDKEPEA